MRSQFLFRGLVTQYVGIEHLHVPTSTAAPGQCIAYTAHPNDPDCLSDQILADVAQGLPCFPPTIPHIIRPIQDATCGRNEESERHVCSGLCEHSRRVTHTYAPRSGVLNIDIVAAHCVVADHVNCGPAASITAPSIGLSVTNVR